jgi:hypothetical protein
MCFDYKSNFSERKTFRYFFRIQFIITYALVRDTRNNE